jgi:dTDP-4-amino-4,6-dideoxygalactose transaminase
VAAVLATGATPVLVDVDPVHYTLDPVAVEAAITPRTRAMIAVHLYGQSADMAPLGAIARRRGLRVVEDCAQAAGGSYHGRRLGSLGDVACFSFYPTKNLGAVGDGGMVTTQDAGLAERVRRLRQYGWDEQRTTREVGVNSRLDPLQAAVLGAKLKHLDADNGRRAAIARMYDRGFAGLPLTAPAVRPQCTHAYHLYVVQSDGRDALMAHLKGCGIGTAVHYPWPVHRQQGYAERAIVPREGLPVTERLVERIVTLPLYPELTDAEVEQVIEVIRAHFGHERSTSTRTVGRAS